MMWLMASSSRLAELNEGIDELTARIARLGDGPADQDEARELLDQLGKLERQRRRALQEGVARGARHADAERSSSSGKQVPVDPVMPVRERVLAGLELLGVPARGGLVSVAAAARTGLSVEARQLASLRRSELASWRAAPDRRPSYLVPALHARRFEPLRGVVACSAWEPWRRIVGPLSPRADHLRATIRVAEHVQWVQEHSADVSAQYERLLWRLARSVPGVAEAAEFDVERATASARAELALVDEQDRIERQEAAERASHLPVERRLFGAGLRVVRGEAAS